MQVHVIHEIDCSVERIDPAVVEAFLDTELSDDPMLADSICAMADAMSAELHPRGVYKLFNPAICTLPPKYTEPAIKLVGTLAFFTQTEKRLGLTAAEDGTPSDRWSTWGVIGLYNETQKKRRGCAYCHNVRTCTIRKIGMTCHGRRTRKKAKSTSAQ